MRRRNTGTPLSGCGVSIASNRSSAERIAAWAWPSWATGRHNTAAPSGLLTCRVWVVPSHNGVPSASATGAGHNLKAYCSPGRAPSCSNNMASACASRVAGNTTWEDSGVSSSSNAMVATQSACGCKRQPSACMACCRGSSGPATCTSNGQRWRRSPSLRRTGNVVHWSRHQSSVAMTSAGGAALKRASRSSAARGACHAAAITKLP